VPEKQFSCTKMHYAAVLFRACMGRDQYSNPKPRHGLSMCIGPPPLLPAAPPLPPPKVSKLSNELVQEIGMRRQELTIDVICKEFVPVDAACHSACNFGRPDISKAHEGPSPSESKINAETFDIVFLFEGQRCRG